MSADFQHVKQCHAKGSSDGMRCTNDEQHLAQMSRACDGGKGLHGVTALYPLSLHHFILTSALYTRLTYSTNLHINYINYLHLAARGRFE